VNHSRLAAGALAVALLGGALGAVATPADAAPKPKAYKNCTALNKVYPHGVGKKNAKDKVSGSSKPVTTFTKDDKTYALNTKSDRDKDGIACEKR
jgi:hypothetical protein